MTEMLYPMGYGTQLVTMAQLRARHEPRMHPEFARRLFEWIEDQDGLIGIGGGWRATGSQPDKPGFAPEGESFHQNQRFPGGLWYAAVDLVARNDAGLLRRIFSLNGSAANPDASTLKRLATVAKVHRAPTWSEVPPQGSDWAARVGVHANVGTPGARGSESWHVQPVELDGWGRWVNAGRPDLQSNYPTPGTTTPPPPVVTPPEIIPPIGDMMGLELELVDETRARVLDTRKPATPAAGGNAGAKLAAGATITVHAHRAGLPTGTKAVAVNLTAADVDGPGFLTAWSTGDRPEKSAVNYSTRGGNGNGFTIVPLSAFGTFEVATGGPTSGAHVIVDVVGAFVEGGS